MTAYKDIVGIVPTLHSVSLLKKTLKKKKKKGVGSKAINTIVGTSLIKAESDFIGGL